MKAVRRRMKIEDPCRLMLADLPFDKGEEVEIVILGKEAGAQTSAAFESVLRETQALPQMKTLSDDDIAAEIEAHRSGR